MPKYRKKPVVIEAFQYQGDTTQLPYEFGTTISRSVSGGSCFIDTLKGTHECRVGDFIIKGIQGEFYPCKPDIFDATYEEVNSDNPPNQTLQKYGFFLKFTSNETDAQLEAELRAGLEEVQPGCSNIKVTIIRNKGIATIKGFYNNAT